MINTTTKTLHLNGKSLTIHDLFIAASDPTFQILPSSKSLATMQKNRQFAEKVAARGDIVYGLSTGVGIRKRNKVATERLIQFQTRMVREHATGQGPTMNPIIIRGSAIVLLNTLCLGRSNVRPSVATRISNRLCHGATRPLRSIPMYGTTGMGDVTPLAHLTQDLIYLINGKDLNDEHQQPSFLQAGEALPLIAQSSVVTAQAALAIYEARVLLQQMNILACLDIEGYAANPSPYHAMVGQVRPYPGFQTALCTMRKYLKGGISNIPMSQQRHLQSPLTYRTCANVLGAAYDALNFCETQINIELNAHQQNPLSLMEEDCMLPCGNFDMQALAQTMDIARLTLGPCLTTQVERSIKMLVNQKAGKQ